MSIIPDFVVVATNYPVAANSMPSVYAGQIAMLNSSGYAVLHDGSSSHRALGLFGDSTIPSTGTSLNLVKATAYAGAVTINAAGQQVITVDRVSDPNANEAAASSKICVYNSGGQFNTDMYETVNNGSPAVYTPGMALYASTNGKLTPNSTAAQVVATCTVAPRAYPSGVPGTDTPDGSLSLGTYITVKLEV